MSKILILTDGKAGHENQSKALARALGFECDLVSVRFRSRGCKALSYLLSRLGFDHAPLFRTEGTPDRTPGAYAAVVGTGSGTFYAVSATAKRLGVPSAVVLYPRGYRLSAFNCILAPAFDRPASAPNVVQLEANLVPGDAAFYARGVAAFEERCRAAGVPPPGAAGAVAVIVGGPNACSTVTPDWMRAQLERLFAENPGAAFWVTTSRRTPPDVESVVASFPWQYRLLYSQDHFNPIPAFVQLARRLYVTAESTGMLSEACTFGKAEVFALDNLKPGPSKFRRFVDDLTRGGYVGGSRKIDLGDRLTEIRRLLGL